MLSGANTSDTRFARLGWGAAAEVIVEDIEAAAEPPEHELVATRTRPSDLATLPAPGAPYYNDDPEAAVSPSPPVSPHASAFVGGTFCSQHDQLASCAGVFLRQSEDVERGTLPPRCSDAPPSRSSELRKQLWWALSYPQCPAHTADCFSLFLRAAFSSPRFHVKTYFPCPSSPLATDARLLDLSVCVAPQYLSCFAALLAPSDAQTAPRAGWWASDKALSLQRQPGWPKSRSAFFAVLRGSLVALYRLDGHGDRKLWAWSEDDGAVACLEKGAPRPKALDMADPRERASLARALSDIACEMLARFPEETA
eukprot:m51a1_g2048 hypothetical protein (311) ;mRNA; f:1385672-1386883